MSELSLDNILRADLRIGTTLPKELSVHKNFIDTAKKVTAALLAFKPCAPDFYCPCSHCPAPSRVAPQSIPAPRAATTRNMRPAIFPPVWKYRQQAEMKAVRLRTKSQC